MKGGILVFKVNPASDPMKCSIPDDAKRVCGVYAWRKS